MHKILLILLIYTISSGMHNEINITMDYSPKQLIAKRIVCTVLGGNLDHNFYRIFTEILTNPINPKIYPELKEKRIYFIKKLSAEDLP